MLHIYLAKRWHPQSGVYSRLDDLSEVILVGHLGGAVVVLLLPECQTTKWHGSLCPGQGASCQSTQQSDSQSSPEKATKAPAKARLRHTAVHHKNRAQLLLLTTKGRKIIVRKRMGLREPRTGGRNGTCGSESLQKTAKKHECKISQ